MAGGWSFQRGWISSAATKALFSRGRAVMPPMFSRPHPVAITAERPHVLIVVIAAEGERNNVINLLRRALHANLSAIATPRLYRQALRPQLRSRAASRPLYLRALQPVTLRKCLDLPAPDRPGRKPLFQVAAPVLGRLQDREGLL